jgi:hypothetical protein
MNLLKNKGAGLLSNYTSAYELSKILTMKEAMNFYDFFIKNDYKT